MAAWADSSASKRTVVQEIVELERCLARLPGFGRRSAARAALALVRESARLNEPLLLALAAARERVCTCSCCGGFTSVEANPCDLCTDATRDASILCVVEDPADVVTVEASGAFNGRYHVLGGKLAPSRRMGPEKLRFGELVSRISREGFTEVLLALSTDMEGDATAGYAAELLKGTGVAVTRLAFGLPADSGIAYSDPLTLKRAIVHRVAQ